MKVTSLLKEVSLSLMGFFAFIVVFTRICFLLHLPITKFTIITSLCAFTFLLIIFLKKAAFRTVFLFLLSIAFLAIASLLMAKTYDTSWDGQGYHQSAVIAFSQGWNPIYEPSINFKQRLPSQIFAESYPSALWEVQANIYSLTGKINSAKVVNLAISIVSACATFLLLRKISVSRGMSLIISLLLVIQPLYVIQFLSFMQDGFGYQVILVAVISLVYFILDKKSKWALFMFILAEIFLASTKYSHLPMVLMLGIIFAAVAGNRFLNKEYFLNRKVIFHLVALGALSLVFAYLPYGRNFVFYHAPFYPTNIPELNGSVTYNNLPHNLEDKGKLVQFFYGIFSSSQKIESSDNRSPENVATLKVPFTFSNRELSDAAKLYNNRAGAVGPLFSGIVVVALVFCVVMSFKAETMIQKYVFYGIFFSIGFIVVTSLLVPTPNLIRYTSQIQFLPFVLFIPVLAVFKTRSVKIVGWLIVLMLIINNAIYTGYVVAKNIDEEKQINSQFSHMRSLGGTYKVKAQQFYSGYVLLAEQGIPVSIVDNLSCKNVADLYASSTTTKYCKD